LGGIDGAVAVVEGLGESVEAASVGPGRAVVGVPLIAHTARHRGRGGGRTLELAQALATRLSAVCSLAALHLGGIDGAVAVVEGLGESVEAASVGPGRAVVGVPLIAHTARHRGRGRGRTLELAQALSAGLSAVCSLTAIDLRVVLWPVAFIERKGHLVLAAGVGPGGLVVGIPEAGQSTRKRGRGRGRTLKLAEALPRRLSSVSSLAAIELGFVGGSIVRVKGQRQGVEAAGIGPRRVVIGVPEGGEPARKRWGRGGRGREIAETRSGHLPSE